MLFIELTEKDKQEKLTINVGCILTFKQEGNGCKVHLTTAILGFYSEITVAESYESIKAMLDVIQPK